MQGGDDKRAKLMQIMKFFSAFNGKQRKNQEASTTSKSQEDTTTTSRSQEVTTKSQEDTSTKRARWGGFGMGFRNGSWMNGRRGAGQRWQNPWARQVKASNEASARSGENRGYPPYVVVVKPTGNFTMYAGKIKNGTENAIVINKNLGFQAVILSKVKPE